MEREAVICSSFSNNVSTKAFEKMIVDICRDICLLLWAMAETLRSSFISISGTRDACVQHLDTTKNKEKRTRAETSTRRLPAQVIIAVVHKIFWK